MSLRDSILSASDLVTELVEVPEWGVTVEVRGMSAADRTALIDRASDSGGKLNTSILYPAMVLACSYDPDTGERVFQPGDESAIGEKAGLAVERVVQAAMRASGLSEEAADTSGEGSSVSPSDDS